MKRHGKETPLISTSELTWIAPWEAPLTCFSGGEEPPHFHPEFGRFMLEATPGRPWGIGFKDLLKVESNMKLR
jgi:hypothetical protein